VRIRPGSLANLRALAASTARDVVQTVALAGLLLPAAGAATIIDHTTADIWQIPDAAIEQAKAELHIAYGHTSHGSQLISGMGTSGGQQLDAFMTHNGGTPGMYLWNAGGTGGALDLRDTPFEGAYDLGNPDRYAWEQATRNYLAEHPECNVIIWSWCGQAATTLENIDIYLNLMEGLIEDYPGVHFVFMTGHLNGSGETGQLHIANAYIRDHCLAHDRILYDFADIESYDPDHLQNYMPLLCNDNCDYDSDGDGYRESNWALDWQESHIEGVDWWPSGAAHSQHLNGNLKGYAAWWLWAALAGWSGPASAAPDPAGTLSEHGGRLLPCRPNPTSGQATLAFELAGSQPIELAVFSIDGRRIATLWDGPAGPGRHEVAWAGRDARGHTLTPGAYFLRLRSGHRVQTGKLLLAD
jgi:hypothetical protein